MRQWSVASGLLEADGRLLLVANRRRNGAVDWSPPGGVIDDGDDPAAGLMIGLTAFKRISGPARGARQ